MRLKTKRKPHLWIKEEHYSPVNAGIKIKIV